MPTSINNIITCNEPHANLDSYYGPYKSVSEALQLLNSTVVNGVIYTKRYIGLTVGIETDNGIVEYWFKNGVLNTDLVKKIPDAGLPSGVKVVTFDRNGGRGVQNSILTDTNSQVRLPDCTLTKTNDTFFKWRYDDVDYDAGDIVTIGNFNQVVAIWSSSPVPTQKYSVSWNDSEELSITGTNELETVIIENGQEYDAGTVIKLTATPEPGYVFYEWRNIPTGAVPTGNVLIFTLNSPVSGITARANQVVTQHTLNFNAGEGVSEVTGIIPDSGESVSDGGAYDDGSTITLTATLEEGYDTVDWIWDGEGTYKDNTLTFVLTSDVEITAKGVKATPGDVTSNWCVCVETGEGPVFATPEELHSEDGVEYTTDLGGETEYKALYVIVPNGYTPSCTFEKEIPMTPINECETEGVYEYYMNKGWVEVGSNVTKGELASKGDLMFVFVDDNEESVIKGVVTIKLNPNNSDIEG